MKNEVSHLLCDYCVNEINMQQPVDQRYHQVDIKGIATGVVNGVIWLETVVKIQTLLVTP